MTETKFIANTSILHNESQYKTISNKNPIVAKFEFKMSFSKIPHTILMIKGRQHHLKKCIFATFVKNSFHVILNQNLQEKPIW